MWIPGRHMANGSELEEEGAAFALHAEQEAGAG